VSGLDNQECYRAAAIKCINAITERLNGLMLANALRDAPVAGAGDED
jgi:hypothetical protein